MTGWLDGHVALLVGAGSGIGAAVADAFVADGALVGFLEVDPIKCDDLRRRHPSAVVVKGDARSRTVNDLAVSQMMGTFGRLDSATSFVGVHDRRARLNEMTPSRLSSAFEEVFTVNVLSILQLAAAAEQALRASRGTLILTLSSSAFYAGGGGALYVSSKFALRGVLIQLAHEFAPEIRVNGVAPGGTLDTDLRGLSALDADGVRNGDRPGREDRLKAIAPLGFAARAADHAGAYVYLASNNSRAVTGVVINSDGGLGVRG